MVPQIPGRPRARWPGRPGRPLGPLGHLRAQLADRGVPVSDVQVLDPRDGGKYLFLADPDGNNWAIQEVREYVGATLG